MALQWRKLTASQKLTRFYWFATPLAVGLIAAGWWKLTPPVAIVLAILVASDWWSTWRLLKLRIAYNSLLGKVDH